MLRKIFAITSRILYSTAFGRRPSLSDTFSRIPRGIPNTYPKKVENRVIYNVSPTPAIIISVTCFVHIISSPPPISSPRSVRNFFISGTLVLSLMNWRIISPLATPPTFLVFAFRMFTGSWKVNIRFAITGSNAEFSENTIRTISPSWISDWVSFLLSTSFPESLLISSLATCDFGWLKISSTRPCSFYFTVFHNCHMSTNLTDN